jgi:DNA modification methylase
MPYVGKDLGTFKDSLRAPVHRWFRYPAGYSYKFVKASFEQFEVCAGDWVYDPFSGTGTTLICAKQEGVNGYGVEAHTFVHWVASVKLYWEFDLKVLERTLDQFLAGCQRFISQRIGIVDIEGVFPALVYKCYHPDDLKALFLIREFILRSVDDGRFKELLKLALTETLRGAALAGTGWPYISPRKNTGNLPPKYAYKIFSKTCRSMLSDLDTILITSPKQGRTPLIQNILGDSRYHQIDLDDGQIDLALTSPPYLNNYDYADRTRLETYFWGYAETWSDITRLYRDKLMVAATTQVTRSEHELDTVLSDDIKAVSPDVYQEIQTSVLELAERRLKKGGRKDYDLMTALYFNAMFKVLEETYRVLKKKGHFCLVLGDSAPYGVHMRTDDLIGQLGLGLGFSNYEYFQFRKRGDKWKDNPQRHGVALREGIVVLTK